MYNFRSNTPFLISSVFILIVQFASGNTGGGFQSENVPLKDSYEFIIGW